jgi:uncharacterized delta-60 repeat protein
MTLIAIGIASTALVATAFACFTGPVGALADAPPPLRLDHAFGDGTGVATVGETIPGYREGVALGVAPGGDILAAGEDGYDGNAALVEFDAGGILDSSYGGGSGRVELPGVDGVNGMALDRSGGAAVLSQRTDLTRVTGAGTIDTGFGEDGTVSLPTLAPGFSEFHFWAVAILPDDDVLVAGIGFGSPRMVVLRLLPDGSLDHSFGDDGLAMVGSAAANPNAGAFAMATLQDGDILLGGYAHHDLALARLLPDGSPDPGFGEDGLSTARGIDGQATALAPRPDGSVLAVGYGVRHDQRENLLLRLEPDGAVDPTFGSAARRMPERGGYATPIAVLPSHGHTFVATVGHGPSLRVYGRGGREGRRPGGVEGVPSDRFSGTAATLDHHYLLFLWTPKHQPTRGIIRLERFSVLTSR